MFWARRLKQAENTESSWVLSYGDMVTLLLAVFVMIAAMGDLKNSGERFKQVTGGVRRAFGFPGVVPARPVPQLRRSPTLLERFEQAGFARRSQVNLVGPDDEVLASCDLLIEGDLVILQIAGHASFARGSAALQPAAEKALRRLAEFLADGGNRIEVRGHAGDGPPPAVTAFGDGMDLSYARARTVAAALVQYGVERNRLFVTAWGESRPLPVSPASPRASRPGYTSATQPSGDMPEGADRRIEIVVHAVPAAGHVATIAGKDE